MSDNTRPLGRKEPTDFKHLERYGLLLAAHPEVLGQPLFFGVPWYAAFDDPEEIEIGGHMTYWIGRGNNWGRIRGGHEICAKPIGLTDTVGWWRFYDQKRNSCVGNALSRGMSLLNRKRYDAEWLYDEALKVDEWPGEADEGTSGRAGFDVLRTIGHRRKWGPFTFPAQMSEGIAANRWITNVDDVLAILGTANLYGGCVPWLNSWGTDYPHIVYVPAEAIGRLLAENGDCGAVTDR